MSKFVAPSLAAGLLACGHAVAATYCVGSPEDLAAALAAAQQAQTRSDEVRIRVGHYLAPAGGWHVDVHQAGGISISGGWLDAACATRSLDAALTRLDGHQAERPLTIDSSFAASAEPPAEVVVAGLTIENGSGTLAGGLKIGDAGPIYSGTIRVENNIFAGNVGTSYQQDNSAGALLAATDGPDFSGDVFLVIRDNLFVGNRAPDAAAALLFSNNTIDVVNNTVTGNQALDQTLTVRTAFTTFTLSGIAYSNNIFWANNPDGLDGTFDIRADNAFRADIGAELFNNDLQAVSGTPKAGSGNQSVDPLFVDAPAGDFHLIDASPLVDAGLDAPAGGLADADLDGGPRVRGAHVDMGAYESAATADRVFADGFD